MDFPRRKFRSGKADKADLLSEIISPPRLVIKRLDLPVWRRFRFPACRSH